jgi:hypothetical protein
MRRRLVLGLVGLLGAGALLFPFLHRAYRGYGKTEETKMVEREVRKHDSWVEGHVERDYTDGDERDGFVRLMFESEERRNEAEELGFLWHEGSYNASTRELGVTLEDGELTERKLDSVDHELWHTVFGNESASDSILASEDYGGPSLEEINRYANDKVNGDNFAGLRDLVQSGIESERITGRINTIEAYDELVRRSEDLQDFANQRIEIRERLFEKRHFEDGEIEGVLDKIEELDSAQEAYWGYRDEIQRKWENGEVTRITDFREVSLTELIALREKCDSINERLEELARQAYSAAVVYDESTVELINGTGERRDKEEPSVFEGLSLGRAVFAMPHVGESILDMTKGNKEMVADYNESRMRQILSPNEIMARAIDSLHSVYFGPVTQSKFQLGEGDLEFLGRFTYNGKQMFRKGIEKYRVGMEMLGDGLDPAEIKDRLEYATRFKWNGRSYRWPEADFRVMGNIPFQEDDSEE